jgi:hypothetical protein
MQSIGEASTLLDEHFRKLSQLRRSVAETLPIFALEHPLSNFEIAQLTKSLDADLRRQRTLDSGLWLVWIVAATECGYDFRGLEFWPNLEKRVPSWAEYGDRNRLRDWFRRFHHDYNGVEPSGHWARHRSVICWPITHSILPRDLQHHLCAAIYAARYHLFGLRGLEHASIGRIVASYAPAHSLRFDDFMKEHLLVGRIVHRLLVQDSDASPEFLPSAFRRILADLSQTASAREWLREVSKGYGPRLVGPTQGPPPDRSRPSLAPSAGVTILRPNMFLRKESGQWRPWLAPPSLLSMLQREPLLREALTQSRFRILGVENRAFQSSNLLTNEPRPVGLSSWPAPDTPLVELIPSQEDITRILNTDCVLHDRVFWVFRIEGDRATLQEKPYVAPGEAYLIATNRGECELGTLEQLSVSEFELRMLAVPDSVGTFLAASLQNAGLSVRRSASIKPWGLVPRQWDEERGGEWLSSEPVILVVERDHLFDGLTLSLNGESASLFKCCDLNDPTIVINDLTEGIHQLAVSTLELRGSGSLVEWHKLADANVTLRVRQPSTWRPGYIDAYALRIEIEPAGPTLDEFFSGNVRVSLLGGKRPVSVELVWSDGRHEETVQLLRQRPPISEVDWASRLGAIDDTKVQLSANSAWLRISCDELGEHRTPLTVASEPVRWSPGADLVRLVYDGHESPTTSFSPFSNPTSEVELDPRKCELGLDHSFAGLLVAQFDGRSFSIVVGKPAKRAVGLQALAVTISVDSYRRTTLSELLVAINRWHNAYPVGLYARTSHHRVVDSLLGEIIRRAAGEQWWRLEYEARKNTEPDWRRLEHAVDSKAPHSYGYALGKRRSLGLSNTALRDAFVAASKAFVCTNEPVIEEAWRLATKPGTISPNYSLPSGDTADAFARLVRGARLVWLGRQHSVAK